ncbi:ABC transporter ATP-binding protein [Mesobacterium pallidum]|uniref:ABC transporter ATP-binding protein n=1 Tax=Mesobacterium pallidum TaxID=2872037 RepID=UPI001EE2B5AA|nr:ATP-binding cassette domain-containing protein [Mesobacterium pallidum]
MIRLTDVTVRFGGVVALNAVSAEFTKPVSGIIGPNGAGKTTLMNVLSGFVSATGTLDKDGDSLMALAPHRRARWGLRRSFQREEIANDLTVFDNVLVQVDSAGKGGRRDEVARMLDLVGMGDKAGKMGAELSGFERRLTDVAKCMVGAPKLIMFDEPAGGMSIEETQRLGDLILSIPKATGAQVLVIDHDVELIARVCAETLVLDFGRRIAFGPTSDVLADPKVKAAYLGTEEIAT